MTQNRILSVVLSALIIFYLYLASGIIAKPYLPAWSDEYWYFVNAKSFEENMSLQAAFTFDGIGSLVFQADTHGFAYPVLNGLFSKIVGRHDYNFQLLHFIYLLVSLIVFWSVSFLNKTQKLMASILLLSFPFASLYAVTFMQEIVHILFAVIASVLLYKIYETKDAKYIIVFVMWLLLASLFRNL